VKSWGKGSILFKSLRYNAIIRLISIVLTRVIAKSLTFLCKHSILPQNLNNMRALGMNQHTVGNSIQGDMMEAASPRYFTEDGLSKTFRNIVGGTILLGLGALAYHANETHPVGCLVDAEETVFKVLKNGDVERKIMDVNYKTNMCDPTQLSLDESLPIIAIEEYAQGQVKLPNDFQLPKGMSLDIN
jgi:hypothetical protein